MKNLLNITQISTCISHCYNSTITALCADWSVWQKNIWWGDEWDCINQWFSRNEEDVENHSIVQEDYIPVDEVRLEDIPF